MLKKFFKIIIIIIIVIVSLFLGVIVLSKYWATPPNIVQNINADIIEVEIGTEITNDFGDIFQEDGNFVQSYKLINNGNSIQKIVEAKTSCACTETKIHFYAMVK